MFEHSVKVPRFYKIAAKYTKEAHENGASVKQLVYEKKHPNLKGILGLVAKTLVHIDVINEVLRRSQLLKKETRLDPWLAKVLIAELLWGKQNLPGESKPVKTIQAYKQILKAHLSEVADNDDQNQSTNIRLKPRYVRINTLKLSVEDAINGFQDEGWKFVEYTDTDYTMFLEKVLSLDEEEFMQDIHIKELLIFPPKTEFYRHPAYKDGQILLQDKASCLPAQLLAPPRGSTVLDMCAAPGMKTTQLAALLNNEGKIFAVEMDQRRFETLNKMIALSGASCVTTLNKDVMAVTNDEIEYILVDPSCTGSGITDRIDIKSETDNNRLKKLSGFQIKILKHALQNFPNARRIVYSTCSVYEEENEHVVQETLASCNCYKLVCAQNYLKAPWLSFGSNNFGEIGKNCLYSRPARDLTNGFFIAVFERVEQNEEQQPSFACTEDNVQDNEQIHDAHKNEHVQFSAEEIKTTKKKRKKATLCTDLEKVEEESVDASVNTEIPMKKKKKKKDIM